MRTTLTNRNNLKLSPPMQTITTMAKPIFIYWQIFKPFCCGDFFGEIVCCPWGIFVMVVCYFCSSVPQMSCLRGSSEQSTTLLTPSPVLSDFRWNYSTLTPGSERSWKKNLSENQLRSGWYLQANSNLTNLWLWGNFTHCFPGSRGLCTMFYATAAESLLCSVNCPI